MTENLNDLNNETREAWETNAQVWDTRMGEEGNDFFQILQWPAITRFFRAFRYAPSGDATAGLKDSVLPLSAKLLEGQHILDIACGNGLTTHKLAELGARITAFDFSANELASAG